MAIEGIAVNDFQGLQNLKVKAQKDANSALPEVSKQFEAIFLQAMLKSMRMGQHFIDESSPFRGKTEETFQDMLDGQYVNDIAKGQGIGLAGMLSRQLQQPSDATASANQEPAKAVEQTLLSSRIMPQHSAPVGGEPSVKEDINDFVKSIWPYARQAATVLGLDPKVLMAQAALETGWGQFVAKDSTGGSSNNLFNIKSSAEAGAVQIKTTEYIADTPIKVNASFKKYPSVEHSFNDYVALIQGNGRYEAALANSADPQRYVDELHRAGYATDPQYSSKIMAIYNGDELQQALVRNGL